MPASAEAHQFLRRRGRGECPKSQSGRIIGKIHGLVCQAGRNVHAVKLVQVIGPIFHLGAERTVQYDEDLAEGMFMAGQLGARKKGRCAGAEASGGTAGTDKFAKEDASSAGYPFAVAGVHQLIAAVERGI